MNLKEYDLERYSQKEIVFKSRRDLLSALQELSSDKDILVTYRADNNKLKSIILLANTYIQFRNGDVSIFAEEDVTEAS